MTKVYSKKTIISLYDKDDIAKMKIIEKINSEYLNRVDSIIRYAKLAEYKKIGIAYCISVAREANKLEMMLKSQFDVVKVSCKTGSVSREDLLGNGWGNSCNPVFQATVLNDEKTDLNILMGLCLGHDILFTKHSTSPSTTLIVKDEVYGNRPEMGIV